MSESKEANAEIKVEEVAVAAPVAQTTPLKIETKKNNNTTYALIPAVVLLGVCCFALSVA